MLRTIRQQFPDECDDRELCQHEYPKRPEGEQQGREALDFLKNKRRSVSSPKRKH